MVENREILKDIDNLLSKIRASSLSEEIVSIEQSILKIGKLRIDLAQFDNILLIGIGKAAPEMVKPINNLLLCKGIATDTFIYTKHNHGGDESNTFESSHPYMDKSCLKSGKLLLNVLKATTANSLTIFCISGGASSLVEVPAYNISFQMIVDINRKLVDSNISIEDVNIIRKELSLIKNGGLSYYTNSKNILSLILSDISSPDLSLVGSGPTIFKRTEINRVLTASKKIFTPFEMKIINKACNEKERNIRFSKIEQNLSNKNLMNMCIGDYSIIKQKLHIDSNYETYFPDRPISFSMDEGVKWYIDKLKSRYKRVYSVGESSR